MPDGGHRLFVTNGAKSDGASIHVVIEWRPLRENPNMFRLVEHDTPYNDKQIGQFIGLLAKQGFKEVVKNDQG